MFRLLFILPCLTLMFQPLNAKVEAPNYNFSLDILADFFPQKNVDDLNKKYGKAEVMNEKNGIQTLKYYVAHIRYKFPVIVQVREGKVLDFFAKLPSYFLHDVFFQSLINRLGKQDYYKRVQEEAVYRWNKNELTHVYSAACTITCFPIFYAVHTKEEGAYKPLMQTLKDSVPKF